jgi:methionine-rich copper-binding protein CopC
MARQSLLLHKKELKMKKILTIIILLFPFQLIAHSQLQSSEPSDKSVVDVAPNEILLTFNQPIRLTTVFMQKENQQKVKINLKGNKELQTSFRLSTAFQNSDDSIDQSGQYSIEWRGIGEDGHIMKGKFSFEVKE